MPGGDLQFYKLSLRQQIFWSFMKNWTIHLDGTGAFARSYGKTDTVPFYEHYYAGGAQSVRGFRANSLGPTEGIFDLNIGGTKKLIGVAEILAPNPFDVESKSVRLSFFLDAGGIYGGQVRSGNGGSYGVKDYLREISMSYGFGFTWIAPIGALKFSWAWPLRTQESDVLETFQFSIGAPF
jgi:outer membrane protein insertion porin family